MLTNLFLIAFWPLVVVLQAGLAGAALHAFYHRDRSDFRFYNLLFCIGAAVLFVVGVVA